MQTTHLNTKDTPYRFRGNLTRISKDSRGVIQITFNEVDVGRQLRESLGRLGLRIAGDGEDLKRGVSGDQVSDD